MITAETIKEITKCVGIDFDTCVWGINYFRPEDEKDKIIPILIVGDYRLNLQSLRNTRKSPIKAFLPLRIKLKIVQEFVYTDKTQKPSVYYLNKYGLETTRVLYDCCSKKDCLFCKSKGEFHRSYKLKHVDAYICEHCHDGYEYALYEMNESSF